MRRTEIAVGLISVAVLAVELSLIRLFDVLLNPGFGYLVLTCALFAPGLAGVYGTLRTRKANLPLLCILLAASIVALLPALRLIQFDFNSVVTEPVRQALWLVALWAALCVPFFLFGRILSSLFQSSPSRVSFLYGINLAGSGLGCLVPLPTVALIGPVGILLVAGALTLVAAAVAIRSRTGTIILCLLALFLTAVPFLRPHRYFEIREYADKHAVRTFRDRGEIELTRWDPVSKIDVIPVLAESSAAGDRVERFKHVAYDGGSQTTRFTPFDGDVDALRQKLQEQPEITSDYFWQRGVLASHYLHRDRQARTLIIGSAGGQETLAALLFGAGHIDAVEMAGAVVDLARSTYADYIGRIFEDPRVRVTVGEGRSFLRSSDTVYDIIQIFSNHTSSTMGSGQGALEAVYLQTVEAYVEYFSHLGENGIVQVNHQVYPRMVATAAAAWRRMGRTDFALHLAVFERSLPEEFLPTLLVKMSPWTRAELDDLAVLFSGLGHQEDYRFELVEHPLDREASFLPDVVLSGAMPAEFVDRLPIRLSPCTDDRPFFMNLRRERVTLATSRDQCVDRTTAAVLNRQLIGGVPSELVNLLFPGVIGLVLATIAVLLPLLFSRAGRTRWRGKLSVLVYFSCLGAGFIAIELTLVQIFIRPIGFPLHAFTVVLFTMLVGSGCGSLWLSRSDGSSVLPIVAILAMLVLFQLVHQGAFELLLTMPLVLRMIGAGVLLLPLAFFLGVPFPRGVLALADRPVGAIAWAYGLNALFSVLGGVLSIVVSMMLGFHVTLWLAALCYVVAGFAWLRLRRGST